MSWIWGGKRPVLDGDFYEKELTPEERDEQERAAYYDSAFTYNTERQFRNIYDYSAYAPEEPEDGPVAIENSKVLLDKILELFFVFLATVGIVFTFPFSLLFIVKVVMRLGKARKIHGPGTAFVLPCIDHVAKIDIRVTSFEIPTLQVITADKGLVEMTAVVFSKVVDPMAAYCGLQNKDQTLRSLAYNIIYNNLVKKMLYDLTDPNALSKILAKCQEEINTFCKNLGVESTKISVTQMNVVKQGENQAVSLFNTLLKSDVGSQMMGHFTPHIKAYLENANADAKKNQAGANKFEQQANGPRKPPPASYPTNPNFVAQDPDLTQLLNKIRSVCDDSLVAKVGKYYRIRCVDSVAGPVEFDINLKQFGAAFCNWTTDVQHANNNNNEGEPKVDVVFALQKETLFNLVNGSISPMTAYINGLVSITGSIDDAVGLKHLAESARECK